MRTVHGPGWGRGEQLGIARAFGGLFFQQICCLPGNEDLPNGGFGFGAGDREIVCFILRGPLAGIIQRWYTLREIKNDVFL